MTPSVTWAVISRGRWRCSDDGGDGVVVTSIHGRSDARDLRQERHRLDRNQQLSPEEEEAIDFASERSWARRG